VWARRWSKAEIDEGRTQDRAAKAAYFDEIDEGPAAPVEGDVKKRRKEGRGSARVD